MPRIAFIASSLAGALLLAGLGGCGSSATNASADSGNAATAEDPTPSLVERGRYLVAIMDCSGCHNVGSFSPEPDRGFLEGGTIGFEIPGLGVFYPPNLTPHPEAGLGRWSVEDIMGAIRTGRRPDGRELSPAMPWRAYAALDDGDARAVATYLKSLPPSPNRVPQPATVETASAPYMTVRVP